MTTRLVDGVLAGQVHSVARMITRMESGMEGIDGDIAEVYSAGGRALIIGVTGSPGSGKSTLVAAMTSALRGRGKKVGIVAVDPTSPYSGGAILGDRIRMGAFTGDPGVFIRSMATRGTQGGLARTSSDAVAVLDAAGFDVVLIETVGIGQDEVDVARASHVTLVISVPGMGDDIQAIKAGVIEIADIHVVNKADRDGYDKAIAELKTMLNLAGPTKVGGWKPPVLPTVAETGDGVLEMLDAVDRFRTWQAASGELETRERMMAAARIRAIATYLLLNGILDLSTSGDFKSAVERVRSRTLDPLAAARELIGGVVKR